MLKLRNAKKAVAMLITVAMCASLTPINKAYASDELTFGNGSSWGIYVATSKNVNTVAGYHGDTNKTQLDPAALSYYGQRDTSKSNDCYYASIVWLKPSATDLHWMYANHPSAGVWDSSKASCENFDIVNVAGSGQMKKRDTYRAKKWNKFYM